MSDGRKYYCLCEANCKFETMTKEQILAAIAQAAETGLVFDADSAFITKVKESNAGSILTFWRGTQAQYTAVVASGKKDPQCFYYITDENHADNKNNPHNVTIAQIGAAPAGYGLGVIDKDRISSADAALAFGVYECLVSVNNDNTGTACSLLVIPRNKNGRIDQYAYPQRDEGGVYYRFSTDGGKTWGLWGVFDPAMHVYKEYRTAERIDGKAVHKKYENGIIKYRLDGETEWNNVGKLFGAAPAGYGLGDKLGKHCDNINTAKEMGLHYTTENTTGWGNDLMLGMKYASLFVENRTGDIYHTLTSANGYSNLTKLVRCSKDDGLTWTPWEYENPPMISGVEYRTTERWNDKPVYKKTISLGKLPESTTKFENLLIADEVLDFSFTTTDNNTEKFIHNNKVTALGRAYTSQYIYATIELNSVLSQYYGYLTISYTKL